MTMEVNDKEVDVEKIMELIREQVEEKKKVGLFNDEKAHSIFEMKSSSFHNHNQNVELYLSVLNQKWDSKEEEPITSHRRILGPFIVLAKKILRKMLKPFSNTILLRQTEFNSQLVKLLNIVIPQLNNVTESSRELGKRIDELTKRLNELTKRLNELTTKHMDLSQQYMVIKQESILNKQRLDRILTEMKKKYALPEDSATAIVRERKNLMDHNYFLFENKFRGRQEEIKKRQEVYLPTFKNSDNVLDIGCGRGEFLEILRENGIKAMGIDMNEVMIYRCKENDLDVKQIDAISYLKSVQDYSLGGIFASHIIEHFATELFIDFIKLCYLKLQKGAVIALETPNPLSIIVSAINFHLDLSHVKPIHPEALKFLLESNGFVDVQIKYLSPYPEEAKLQSLVSNDSVDSLAVPPIKQINENIEKLNNLLFGYQDYVVTGKKNSL